jgi:hypothetical protein
MQYQDLDLWRVRYFRMKIVAMRMHWFDRFYRSDRGDMMMCMTFQSWGWRQGDHFTAATFTFMVILLRLIFLIFFVICLFATFVLTY